MMKQRRIMLPTLEGAKEFVTETSKCDSDIDIFYNRVVVDAKSILRVLSLDLTRMLTVEYSGNNEDFKAYLDTRAAEKTAAAQYLKKRREL